MSTQASIGLHWLTAATAMPERHVLAALGRSSFGKPERPGGFGHPSRRVHESGAQLYCGSDIETQPVVLNAPGEVCETWSSELVKYVELLNGWVTRADLACDVGPDTLARERIVEMHRDFRAGKCKTRIRKSSCSLIQSDGPNEGWTLYLGGKTAALRLRAYDRRGPLRLEFQFRPPNREQGLRLPSLIKKDIASLWRTCARTVEFPQAWYQDLLRGDTAELPPDERISSMLSDALSQFQKQFGFSFSALDLIGITLKDLGRPLEDLTGTQLARLKAWSLDADRLGYDGKKLREVLKK